MKGFVAVSAAAALLLGGGSAHAQKAPAVKVGLEVLAAEGGGILKGRKVGLMAHASSVTSDGRHSIDVLRAAGVNVVRVFSPERAVRVRGAAWDKVAHNQDGTPWSDRRQSAVQTWADVGTKIPVQGLFGDRAWLKAEDLKGMDALVFDLQDSGTRTFTITGLMVLGMEAAAAAGIDFVVLDRPNPLGGELVQGPVADGWGGRQTTLTTVAPGPLMPGLTVGELARDPLTSASAPGFTLTPATFTPQRSTAAANPKHSGTACQGVKVAVSQARAARPYQLGIALLRALHGQGGVQWKSPTALDDLLGTRKVRAAIERGDSVGAIVAADAAEHEAFQKERLKAILY